MRPTQVVNIRSRQRYNVYIGRGSQWGNPFRIGPDGTREEVIEKYREWIQTQPQLLAQLPMLKGKRLGCYCAPLPCHGDVLCELAEAIPWTAEMYENEIVRLQRFEHGYEGVYRDVQEYMDQAMVLYDRRMLNE